MTECTLCGKGKYSSTPGSLECIDAPRGSRVESEGADAFTQCEPGTNQSQEGMWECPACPSGTYTAQPGRELCIVHAKCVTGKEVAQAGTATMNTVCQNCKPGSYSDDAGTCKLCAKGYAQSVAGAGQCYFCGAGSEVADTSKDLGNVGCSNCTAGKKSSSSQEACTDCAVGKFSDSGSADLCQACPHGRYASKKGSTVCEACAKGHTQAAPGSTECVECAAGKYMDIDGSFSPCVLCDKNHYSAAGATICTACASGKEATDKGMSECTDVSTTQGAFSQWTIPNFDYSMFSLGSDMDWFGFTNQNSNSDGWTYQ